MKKKIAFVGFGNVGKALAGLLLQKKDELKEDFCIEYCITGIATASHGMAINQSGLDIEQILSQNVFLTELNTVPNITDTTEFLQHCEANILFENTPVNYKTGQPALDYLRIGLENGMHVITANKGPVVHGYHELSQLARMKAKKFYFESTVMDGAPIFSLFREALPAIKILSFKGILNSTTNMILSLVEEGHSFEDALLHCQKIGIAESDPSGDIDGWDAAVKISALAEVLMDEPIKPNEIPREGIRKLSEEQIRNAHLEHKRWKLLCYARKDCEGFDVWVKPTLVDSGSPFYQINGTSSIIEFETDLLGKLSIIENDPSPFTTAYGLFADFINAIKVG